MTELIDVSGYMPILTREFSSFMAAEHVEDRFDDAMDYAGRVRDIALDMMRDLSNLAAVPGLDQPDRNFDFDLIDPDIESLQVPQEPDINIPSFEGEFPNIGPLQPPAASDIVYDDPYDPQLKNRLKQEFIDSLNNPDGTYAPDVEQAVYDRARSRRLADLQQKKDNAYDEFAKRGFAMPPGALAQVIHRYDVEDHREEENLNFEIIKLQADLAKQKFELIVQSGLSLESALIERARQRAATTLEQSRLQAQQTIDIFATELRKAEVHASLLQGEVSLFAEKARLEAVKVDIYRSQVEAVTSEAELEKIKVQIMAEERQAQSDKYRFQLEQDRLNLEYALQKQAHKREIATQAANIAAQLAASAMTSVSASASLSGSQSDSNSTGYDASVSRSDNVGISMSI